jgi:TonB family protein
MNWYRYLADASVRAVALAAMAAVITLFLRKKPAAQHALWTLVVIGMLALPVLRLVVPEAYVYVVERPAPDAAIAPPAARFAGSAAAASTATRPARTAPEALRLWWPVYAAIAYLAGVVLFAVRLMAGFVMTRRLLRGARPIDAGVGARIAESDQVRVPVTIGLRRMRVLLPIGWREWPAEKMKAVLAHELAHARRFDPAIGFVAAVNKCIFWFHPLAWWLERRLAVLAEHVADDAGLAVSADSGSYARVLLEVAAGMEGQSSRLIWNASAMNGQLVARRIRRAMDPRTKPGTGRLGNLGRTALLSIAAILIWISAAVDLQSVARAQAKPSPEDANTTWLGFRSERPQPDTATPEQAAQMEQQLAADPEDEATRSKLLRYYWQNNMLDRRIPLVLWLIDHHPESALHGYGIAAIFPGKHAGGSRDNFEDARSRWLAQVNLHPYDSRVLGNAARALGAGSIAEEIDLMKRAQTLDPAQGTEPLAMLDAMVLMSSNEKDASRNKLNDPALAAQIGSELQGSNDAVLVGKVARRFVDQATAYALLHAGRDFTELRRIATGLVAHAQALEPQNRDWADLMEGVNGLPSAAAHPPAAPPAQSVPAGQPVVRIGSGVAAAMLLQSSPPVYPPLAQIARIQGVVKLQVRIGTDGHVTEATVISGHPLLVPAAMDAVRQYVYKPVTLQGQAVEATTTVEVAFSPDRE